MNLNNLIAGLLVVTAGSIAPSQAATETVAQPAQLPLIAQTTEPASVRPAIASVDPNQPIQIRVINQSAINVNIASQLMQPASDERVASPENSVTFGRLHTSYLPLPLDLSIFAMGNDVSLENLKVSVVDNEIIVTVAAVPGVTTEARAIVVDETGSIYLY